MSIGEPRLCSIGESRVVSLDLFLITWGFDACTRVAGVSLGGDG